MTKPQCKTLKVKFPRNPQYTPATLSEDELTRIERLVKVCFGRTHKDPITNNGYDRYQYNEAFSHLVFWINPKSKNVRFRNAQILKNVDAQEYFENCYKYLLAVGRRNGELEEYRETSGKYAMAEGYI